MARVLAYTTPGRGHLYPLIPILAELRRRGHQVERAQASSAVQLRRCSRPTTTTRQPFDSDSVEPTKSARLDQVAGRGRLRSRAGW